MKLPSQHNQDILKSLMEEMLPKIKTESLNIARDLIKREVK